MNQANEDFLINNFPNLYPPYDPLYPLSPTNNRFSFACGDGWFDLLRECSARLEKEIIKQKAMFPMAPREELPHAQQVKEKFGTLRFYLSTGTDEMYQIINEAEERSAQECEECGQPGCLRQGGWISTLCDAHANGRKPYGSFP